MKISIFYMIIIFMFLSSCEDEYYSLSRENFRIEFHGENRIGEILWKRIKEENIFQDIHDHLNHYDILLDYTTIGNTSDFGYFYFIPLRNAQNVIEQSLILPVTDFNLNEKIGKPVVMNYEYLNEKISPSKRFLYLYRFMELGRKGLRVKKELMEFALQLNNKIIPIGGNINSKASQPAPRPLLAPPISEN